MRPAIETVTSMMSAMGLQSVAAIQRRLAFFDFSEADRGHLQQLHRSLSGLGPELAERFYDHMLRFPETRRFITDVKTLNRLKLAQADYFDTLTSGEYDLEHVRNRLCVGMAHQRIGLDTQWYLGAYTKYLSDLIPEIWQRLGENPERFVPALQALIKTVFLDAGIAIETYIHADRRAILSLKEGSEQVLSAIPDGLVVLDSDFAVLSANPAFLRLFGLEEDDVRGQFLLSVVAADGLRAWLLEVRDSGTVVRDLLFEMGVTGAPLRMPVRVTLTGMRSTEDVRLLIIVEDLSEQVSLQQALRASEATLLHAQEVARIGSWQLDFGAGTIAWTPETYRIFGVPPSTTVTYETFLACVHQDDREMVHSAWQAAIRGEEYHLQHRINMLGETRWVEERAKVEFDPEGQPVKAVGVVQDITERKVSDARIEYLAFYDSLTGLPNRALFIDRLRHEVEVAERRSERLSLLFLDLDRFKEINDTLGHDAGDKVLVEVARRLKQALRAEDTLARHSGDEFIIIIAGSADAATGIAERIRRTLEPPIPINSHTFTISASIGIATFPEDGRFAEDLFKHADIAMHRAKALAGGHHFYRAEMGEKLVRKREIARRLEAALTNGSLQLHYQPQIHLSSGRLVGAEALARWHDPEWGDVSPADFIPIAEERGLIVALGEWAANEACRQVRQWCERDCPIPGKVAINVAPRQFDDDAFLERMLSIVRENQVAAHHIELELTESGMMREPERAIEVTRALAKAGFGLSIDDFGTGHSSLAYLTRFPVNKLKIDISFVREMLTNRNDHAIVSTIIAMGRNMELETLAEGVEQADQVDALLTMGCQLAQGYHFGRPLAARDFHRVWLARPTR